MTIPLLQAKSPLEIEARNFRRGYREPQIGKVYTIQVEVDQETWQACELIPKTATIKGVIWWENEDDPTPFAPHPELNESPKEKSVKGCYSTFWNRMVRKGVKTYPDLQEALNCTPERVWDALHAAFQVETMSVVSPRQFESWVTEKGLNQALITMSRNAEVEAAKAGTSVS